MKIQLAILGSLMLQPVLRTQNVFVAFEGNTPRVIRAVRYERPYVDDGKKLRDMRGSRYALQRAAVYSSNYVEVTHEQVQVHHLEDLATGGRINYEMRFQAVVKADANLQNCFMVLELKFEEGLGYVFQELPNLEAGEVRSLEFLFPLNQAVGRGNYKLHLFSNGLELLTSHMLPTEIAAQRRRTQEFILRNQPDRNVVAADTVAPVYPPDLSAERVTGSATVRCRVAPDGRLVESRVVAATHPAFGEAALAAVREWKFGAAIKNHQFVEATIDLPFEFTPPPETGK
jgi:TonB family protein